MHCRHCGQGQPDPEKVLFRAIALYYAAESIYKGSPSWERLPPNEKNYWKAAALETFSNPVFCLAKVETK